jgi:hypothetical protein
VVFWEIFHPSADGRNTHLRYGFGEWRKSRLAILQPYIFLITKFVELIFSPEDSGIEVCPSL